MHQCLSCGNIIPDEMAVEVLRGCRQCKGTRYYYTVEPLGESERQELLRKAQTDVGAVVAEVLQREAPDAAAGVADWAELRPRDLRRLVREVQQRRQAGTSSPAEGGWEYEDARPLGIQTAASRARVAEEMEAREKAAAKPDTVDVGDGAYEIDVKALLERSPIVVHKDGSYLIHLPSLFGKGE